jgi:TatD DNase family protein
MLSISNQFSPYCRPMMGLHPCSVKENYVEELAVVKDHLVKNKFIAIGEIGLDFYWDVTFKSQQFDAFHQQIDWALAYDLPIVIHSRNSIDECISVITEHQKGRLKGVFHCFSGAIEQAKKIIDLNFYLGIGGVVTFKNSGLDKLMEQLTLENVVLETDAPYLAPVPFRGKRNECSYLKYVLEKLSEIKNMNKEEIAAITTANTEKLFGL